LLVRPRALPPQSARLRSKRLLRWTIPGTTTPFLARASTTSLSAVACSLTSGPNSPEATRRGQPCGFRRRVSIKRQGVNPASGSCSSRSCGMPTSPGAHLVPASLTNPWELSEQAPWRRPVGPSLLCVRAAQGPPVAFPLLTPPDPLIRRACVLRWYAGRTPPRFCGSRAAMLTEYPSPG
jgi:hypothetical protein